MSSFIPYGRQSVDDGDLSAVERVLKSDYLTQGPEVPNFEAALASYCGIGGAVVISSGTAALHAACFAADIAPGDEVIVSPMSFAATSNAVLYMGGRPVFVDIEFDTGNIDAALVEAAITKNTKAIIPVHYAGHPTDMDAINSVADKHGLVVIEDACHALGAQYKGRKAGALAHMAAFSFHPVKPITTGEGGAVIANDEALLRRLITFRSHGITKEADSFRRPSPGPWYHEMQQLGYNYRLSDMQAALGLSQLGRLDSFIKARRSIAAAYNEAFADNEFFELPPQREYAVPGWHLYAIRLNDALAGRRAELMEALRAMGIGTQVHYIPTYMHPYYEDLGYKKGLCPVSEDFYKRQLSIPIFPAMTEDEIARVIEAVPKACREVLA